MGGVYVAVEEVAVPQLAVLVAPEGVGAPVLGDADRVARHRARKHLAGGRFPLRTMDVLRMEDVRGVSMRLARRWKGVHIGRRQMRRRGHIITASLALRHSPRRQ